MSRLRAVFLSNLVVLITSISSAGIITVPGDQPTIQAGIDAAVDGDEVIVSPGTYVENIHFNGKNITLRSTDPTNPSVVESTIIDGNQIGNVVMFAGTETDSCTLSGFTITNGWMYLGGDGGALMAIKQPAQ